MLWPISKYILPLAGSGFKNLNFRSYKPSLLISTNSAPINSILFCFKKSYSDSSGEATAFTTAVEPPAAEGKATLSLTNTQTDALKAGRYVYDVELSYTDSADNTIIERILEGQLTVTPSVTK